MAVDLLARLPTPRRAAAAAPAAAPKARAPGGDGALVALGARAAPALRLTDAGGRTVDLGDLGDEVVLVNFWASWCAPCVKEIASLSRLANTFEGRAFRLLAVNVGETPEQVEAFFADLDMDPGFDLLFDRDGEAARAWRVYAVPSSYLVDRHQRVRYGYRGALRWDGPRVIELVDGLLE